MTTEWVVPEAPPNALQRSLQERPWVGPVLVGGLLALGTAYTAWQDPNAGGVFPACPLKSLTGLDCPGCGGLRATHALTQGDIAMAFDHNVFLAVLMPLAAVAWAVWLVRSVMTTVRLRRGADPAEARPRAILGEISTSRVLYAIGAVALAFAVVRNITAVPLFEYLNSSA